MSSEFKEAETTNYANFTNLCKAF